MVAVFFRVDAAAILLTIEAQRFRYADAFLPSCPIVFIIEDEVIFFSQILSQPTYLIMVLIAGVEQAGCKGIITLSGGILSRSSQAGLVTVVTTVLRGRSYRAEEFFEEVFVLIYDVHAFDFGPLLDRIQASAIFLVWVDIVIEKEAGQFYVLLFQFLNRIQSTVGATDMKEYFHGVDFLAGLRARQGG